MNKVFILICLNLSIFSTTAQQVQSIKDGVFKIGAPANHFPFAGIIQDSNNKFEGYEIDIAIELCNRMKIDCRFELQFWDRMIPSVRFNKYDFSVGGMSITPNRLRVIDFSMPITISPAQFAIRRGHELEQEFVNLKGFIGLNELDNNEKKLFSKLSNILQGKRVAVISGTTHLRFIETKLDKILVVKLARDVAHMLSIVNSGEADFAIADVGPWKDLKKAGKLKNIVVGGPELNEGEIGDGVGFPIRRNSKLLSQINSQLQALKEDGTLAKFAKKWNLPMPR